MHTKFELTFNLMFDKDSNVVILSKKLQIWTDLCNSDFGRERERVKSETVKWEG